MKKRVPEMPLAPATGVHPVEAERSSIHLVPTQKATPASPFSASPAAAPRIAVVSNAARKSQHVRASEKMSTLTLAGAAILAPVVWLGHAILVWLDIF